MVRFTPKSNNWWLDTTLQDRDRSWLHRNDAVVTVPPTDGDHTMDEPGGVKRDATEAGLTSNSDTKRPVMEPPTSGRPGAEAASRTGAAAVTNGASTAGNGQETAVDLSHKPERGVFTETRTALLNHTAFFSMNKVDKSAPVVLRVRLNAPYSIYDDNTLVAQTINVAKLKGLSNCQSAEISANNYTTFTASNNFPTVIVGATQDAYLYFGWCHHRYRRYPSLAHLLRGHLRVILYHFV